MYLGCLPGHTFRLAAFAYCNQMKIVAGIQTGNYCQYSDWQQLSIFRRQQIFRLATVAAIQTESSVANINGDSFLFSHWKPLPLFLPSQLPILKWQHFQIFRLEIIASFQTSHNCPRWDGNNCKYAGWQPLPTLRRQHLGWYETSRLATLPTHLPTIVASTWIGPL